jgi:hypothetical protein
MKPSPVSALSGIIDVFVLPEIGDVPHGVRASPRNRDLCAHQ